MVTKLVIALAAFVLTGCVASAPTRPVLVCKGECTYYGPQQPNPNVEMARVLTGGAVKVVTGLIAGEVLRKAVDGGGVVVAPGSSNTTHIERVSDTSESVHTSESVRDYSDSTAVSDTTTNIQRLEL